MPQPPADKPSDSPAHARPVVMLQSPREAAARAIVYRRRRAERPRDRGLHVLGLVGTLLVHLLVLFGAVLGPAYDLEEPVFESTPLQVRLIDKPEPPPPPVRGTPPRRIGPVHRGRAASAASGRTEQAAVTPPTPAPTRPELPVITVTAPPATIRIAQAAAPPPPLTLPRPQPQPALAPVPVPLAGTPPQVNLETPPATRPVPPKFQPEPVRRPQAEGNQPMPTPPSLAMPAVPAQAPPPTPAPSIALEQVAPPDTRPLSAVPLVRPQAAAAPAAPAVEAVPLPAPAAPAINLTPQLAAPTPSVPRERPRVQAPAIQLAEPQLAAVPLSATASPTAPQPAAPAIELPKATTPAASIPLARPQAPAVPSSPAAASAPAQTAAPSATPTAEAKAAETGNAPGQTNAPSSAPEATPQGSDIGVPGAREGTAPAPTPAGTSGQAAPQAGQGSGQGEGRQGKAQAGAAQGAEQGQLGGYIQLKPHGDTEIMEHRAPDIGYKPTRFEGDWAPQNESSLDTALRRAVEKTTVKHTFHLPRGVRVECDLSVLRLFAPFGCGNPDPPAKAGKAEDYRRQYLAPAKSLDPTPAASVAGAASTAPPAAPVHLDNAAACAAARISGGPLPPDCPSDAGTAPRPAQAPAASSSSWVPASDQFQ